MKKRGFTLIELLVVIAIISLLAAILFPVFATARDKARQAACASNEKQIGLAAMQYVQDYDEGYPWSLMGGTYYLTGPGNPNSLLSPYIKSANVTHCPSEGNGWSVASVDATTYAYNTHFGNYKTGSPSVQTTVYLPELTSPSETILLGESSSQQNNLQPGDAYYSTFMQNYLTPDGTSNIAVGDLPVILPFGRHAGGVNEVFADGHVKWMNVLKLWSPKPGQTMPPSHMNVSGADVVLWDPFAAP